MIVVTTLLRLLMIVALLMLAPISMNDETSWLSVNADGNVIIRLSLGYKTFEVVNFNVPTVDTDIFVRLVVNEVCVRVAATTPDTWAAH
jgi:hypothetical protein